MGNICCAEKDCRKEESEMLREAISRSVTNTEGPMPTMEDEHAEWDDTSPETPEKGMSTADKFQKIKDAMDLLTLILYNPTRKGLNG